MSILKTTNSGILSMPLTPETAKSLGWKIERTDGQKNKMYKKDWKCIDMKRDDICAPLQFWYEPQEVLKSCEIDLYFFGDEDEFGLESTSSRYRNITNVKELLGCLEFLKEAEECRKKMKKLWNKHMKKLKDPNAEYYDSYDI